MPRSDTRQKIVDLARDLLHRRGFDGFSYADISGALGIRNAAVHYHFSSKADLGLAVMEEYGREILERIEQARKNGVPPRRQMDAYFEQVNVELCERDWTLCPMGAVAAGYDSLSESMQEVTRRILQRVHAWMAETLEQGRQQGEFQFSGAAQDKALEIACAMQGARQMSRLGGKNAVATVADQIRQDLYT